METLHDSADRVTYAECTSHVIVHKSMNTHAITRSGRAPDFVVVDCILLVSWCMARHVVTVDHLLPGPIIYINSTFLSLVTDCKAIKEGNKA